MIKLLSVILISCFLAGCPGFAVKLLTLTSSISAVTDVLEATKNLKEVKKKIIPFEISDEEIKKKVLRFKNSLVRKKIKGIVAKKMEAIKKIKAQVSIFEKELSAMEMMNEKGN